MRRSPLPYSALLFAALLAPEARADEDELILALEPAYGFLAADQNYHGVGGGGSAWIGLTETLWLMGTGSAIRFFYDNGASCTIFEGYAGLVAALDVLRVIPFFEGSIGLSVNSEGALAPGVRVGLGADYLISPTISLGAVVRYTTLDDEIARDGLLAAQLRLGLRLEL